MSDIPLVTYSVELLEATINKQVERIEKLEAALREIDKMATAKCDVALAHQMADCAWAALNKDDGK